MLASSTGLSTWVAPCSAAVPASTKGIVEENWHVQAVAAYFCQALADAAKTHDAQPLPLKFLAHHPVSDLEIAAPYGTIELRELPCHGKHQHEGVLCRRFGRAVGCKGHRYPALRRGLQVNGVNPGPVAGNHLQLSA